MRRTTTTLLASLAVLGLALSACGGSSKKDASSPTTKADSSTSAPAGGGSSDCGSTKGTTVTVDIGNFVFDPTPVKVKACDSVVWKNTHNQAHTSTGNGDQSWSTGNIAPGASAMPIVMTTKGSLTYMCALHPFMKGVVEVS